MIIPPYAKSQESPEKNVNAFLWGFFLFNARLIAITYNYDNSSFPVYN